MTPRDRELLTGMGNCYEACGSDFAGTIGMVADARSLPRDEVVDRLRRMKTEDRDDPEYRRLRARFPVEFPV